MMPTNYFKVSAPRRPAQIIAFAEATRGDIRVAFDMARTLARRGGRLSVCYPLSGKWAKVPAILPRSQTPRVRATLPAMRATAHTGTFGESWCW